MKQWIVQDDPEFLVVNKPAGILSQKDKSGEDDLAALLQKDFSRNKSPLPFLAPVHRLDRNTSGLILLAKTPEMARQLTDDLQQKKIKRTYLAIVKGDPGERGRYEYPLKKNEKTNEVFVSPEGEQAITLFERLQKLGNSSLVKVELLTGRSHQIRVHFSHAGHALIGDRKYAKKPWSEIFLRPALHSAELQLADGRKFTAELPSDFSNILQKLGGKIPRVP